MRINLALPHVHLVSPHGARSRSAPPLEANARRQRAKDYLAVAAVLLLILATAAVILSYVIHEAPAWRRGQMAGFAPTPAVAAQQAAALAAEPSSPASDVARDLGRVPLILISTAIEMAIFVALGLYLRHDMNRKR
jgi:hypothetical protein